MGLLWNVFAVLVLVKSHNPVTARGSKTSVIPRVQGTTCGCRNPILYFFRIYISQQNKNPVLEHCFLVTNFKTMGWQGPPTSDLALHNQVHHPRWQASQYSLSTSMKNKNTSAPPCWWSHMLISYARLVPSFGKNIWSGARRQPVSGSWLSSMTLHFFPLSGTGNAAGIASCARNLSGYTRFSARMNLPHHEAQRGSKWELWSRSETWFLGHLSLAFMVTSSQWPVFDEDPPDCVRPKSLSKSPLCFFTSLEYKEYVNGFLTLNRWAPHYLHLWWIFFFNISLRYSQMSSWGGWRCKMSVSLLCCLI